MSQQTTEVVKEEGAFKMKKKKKPSMKKLNKKDNVTKVDLTKKQEDADTKPIAVVVPTEEPSGNIQTMEEGTSEPEVEQTETTNTEEEKVTPIIQEITDVVEETTETPITPTPIPDPIPEVNLPENVEKLVDFMKETGGTVEDYVRLNADYTNVDGTTLLKEYYKQTKPHLDLDEINFLMEDKFHYDEDMDEERDVRKKKLAMKEEIAEARNFLESLKGKYYDEIKLRPGVTQEQQKATDFFNRYNEEQTTRSKQHTDFISETNNYFTKDFKGFEFNLGEKKFRYGVNNPTEVAKNQSDISVFLKKFLKEDGSVKDHKGYHKAMYAAKNADTIAQHFYEQGKADATKNIVAKSKNINSEVRNSAPEDIYINGLRVKAMSGMDSSKLKIKTRKNKT